MGYLMVGRVSRPEQVADKEEQKVKEEEEEEEAVNGRLESDRSFANY